MRQLVQLKSHAEEFKANNATLIFVFREESEGVDGLKKIKEKHDPPFVLALDLDKKSSKDYSPKRMTFDNYVIDSKGKIRGVIDGSLRDRAKSDELLKVLKEIQADGN
ncbi:MAG: peroxiredoxin family protein [Rubripirellula sp.]